MRYSSESHGCGVSVRWGNCDFVRKPRKAFRDDDARSDITLAAELGVWSTNHKVQATGRLER
jgi:hypothetical protein